MYDGLAFTKPHRPSKAKKKLKAKYKPIPMNVKQAVLEEKGRFCFLGHCPNCGAVPVTVNDDFYHFAGISGPWWSYVGNQTKVSFLVVYSGKLDKSATATTTEYEDNRGRHRPWSFA